MSTDSMQCECFTWATDNMSLILIGNGHNPNCRHYQRSPWRVFRVGEEGWYLARTWYEAMEAAKEDWLSYGQSPDGPVEVVELTVEDLCDLTFCQDTGSYCSFLEQFARRIREPGVKASLFASGDW